MRKPFGVLVLVFLAFAAFAEAQAPKSIFLVAKRDLPDPNFRDTVVLVTKSQGPAPVGVILNRRLDLTVGKALANVENLKGGERKVHFGGPVRPQGVVLLFRAPSAPQGSTEVLDGIYMTSSRERVVDLLTREHSADALRVYVGHASWAPGQLESEIARGTWHVVHADARSIFARNPETLWPQLERKAANTAALLSAPRTH